MGKKENNKNKKLWNVKILSEEYQTERCYNKGSNLSALYFYYVSIN